MIASYGCDPGQSRGRRFPEPPHAYRNPFQRDRDRIIHAAAFRRLEFKTQVFGYHESDYVRNRLTHTLEVSQIARSLARSLGLNEDLAEAIALSHDIGHPPFGHAGEHALDEVAQHIGGFNHNIQGLRIVDELEQRYGDFPGLNLTFEVREAFAKHGSGRNAMPDEFMGSGTQASLEAQIVDMVDELAYTSHDIDDGLAHGRLQVSDLDELDLWARPFHEVRNRYPDATLEVWRHETIRRVINRLATDLFENSRQRIRDSGVDSVDAVRNHTEPLIAYGESAMRALVEMKRFLLEHLYRDYRVVQMNQKARRIVTELYTTFRDVPQQMPPGVRNRCDQDGIERTVVDYIAAMTDKAALELWARLFANG